MRRWGEWKGWTKYEPRKINCVTDPFLSDRRQHGKNGFVTGTKLGTTNEFFVASTKNFAAATKRFVDRTKHFVVVTSYFCYPYILTNDFVGITKPFFSVMHWPSWKALRDQRACCRPCFYAVYHVNCSKHKTTRPCSESNEHSAWRLARALCSFMPFANDHRSREKAVTLMRVPLLILS